MSVAFIAVTGSLSVRLVGLHIHGNLARSAADPMVSSRCGDRHEISGVSGFGDALGNGREYWMMLSVLPLVPLSSFSFPPQE